MRKRPLRNYISCYSCDYSKIRMDDGKKIVYCQLSDKITTLKSGMSYPGWCKVAGSLRKEKL